MPYIKPYMRTVVVPWPAPQSVYHNDGADCDVMFGRHRFVIRRSGDSGINTGRTRWTVSCMTCGDLIHPGSTSARAQIRAHLFDEDGDYVDFLHQPDPSP